MADAKKKGLSEAERQAYIDRYGLTPAEGVLNENPSLTLSGTKVAIFFVHDVLVTIFII